MSKEMLIGQAYHLAEKKHDVLFVLWLLENGSTENAIEQLRLLTDEYDYRLVEIAEELSDNKKALKELRNILIDFLEPDQIPITLP